MLTLAARHFTGRPDAHLAVIEDLSHDGFDGFRVEVCDVVPCKSGPRKGQPNWRTAENRETRYITWPEFRAFEDEWSRETGKCNDCMGSGEVFAGWSIDTGTRMKPCAKCEATGVAP